MFGFLFCFVYLFVCFVFPFGVSVSVMVAIGGFFCHSCIRWVFVIMIALNGVMVAMGRVLWHGCNGWGFLLWWGELYDIRSEELVSFLWGGGGEKIVGIEIAAAVVWVIWGNVWWLSVCWRHGQLFKQFERFL
jgi:hypothetical protein